MDHDVTYEGRTALAALRQQMRWDLAARVFELTDVDDVDGRLLLDLSMADFNECPICQLLGHVWLLYDSNERRCLARAKRPARAICRLVLRSAGHPMTAAGSDHAELNRTQYNLTVKRSAFYQFYHACGGGRSPATGEK